jgi:hypothetical protein
MMNVEGHPARGALFSAASAAEQRRLRISWNPPSFRHPGVESLLPGIHQAGGEARKRPDSRTKLSPDTLPVPAVLGNSFEAPLRDFLHLRVSDLPAIHGPRGAFIADLVWDAAIAQEVSRPARSLGNVLTQALCHWRSG